MQDYLLDGSTNWSVDRRFCEQLLAKFPQFKDITAAGRQLVDRVVRYLARRGVRQFIDIGSGVLSTGNTHQVADAVAPNSRVVYVDNEPVAVAHAEVLLDEAGDPDRHAVLNADLREPNELWSQVEATGIIDEREPLAVLMFSVLHLFPSDRTGNDILSRALTRYRELLPAGSYLGISHITDEGIPGKLVPMLRELKQLHEASCASEVYFRPRSAIKDLLGDLNIIDPGMVWAPDWRPDAATDEHPCARFDAPNEALIWTGVGQRAGMPAPPR